MRANGTRNPLAQYLVHRQPLVNINYHHWYIGLINWPGTPAGAGDAKTTETRLCTRILTSSRRRDAKQMMCSNCSPRGQWCHWTGLPWWLEREEGELGEPSGRRFASVDFECNCNCAMAVSGKKNIFCHLCNVLITLFIKYFA